MNLIRRSVLAALCMLLFAGCNEPQDSGGQPEQSAVPTETATTETAAASSAPAVVASAWTGDAINFSFTTAEGESRTADSYAGKPLVLNFWAAWWGWCIREFPHFSEVYQEYDGQFNLLSIAKDEREGHGENPIGPREMVAQMGWSWDFGYGEHVAEAYGITKIPVTLFIDAAGNISHTQTGYMEKDEFVYQLERILP